MDFSSDNDSEDTLGIARLTQDFEVLIDTIAARVESLTSQALQSSKERNQEIQDTSILKADQEIHALKNFLKQCDEFELDFLKIQQIGEIVKEFKIRIQQAEKIINS